nr:hypothetical protein Iba_chr10aCG10650 [Ipomoea batatas]
MRDNRRRRAKSRTESRASSRESAGMDLIADIAPATCKTAAASSAEKPRVGSFSMSYDELTLKEERRNSKGLGTEKGYRDQMLIWFLINFTHPLVYRGFRQVSDCADAYLSTHSKQPVRVTMVLAPCESPAVEDCSTVSRRSRVLPKKLPSSRACRRRTARRVQKRALRGAREYVYVSDRYQLCSSHTPTKQAKAVAGDDGDASVEDDSDATAGDDGEE